MKSIFTYAKVVAEGVAAESYIQQEDGVVRGDPRYVMGRSSLLECLNNPFRWVNGFEEQDTKSTDWGTLRDCLVLDASNFDKRFVVRPATYPAPAKHLKVRRGEINEGDPLPWHPKAKECEDWLEEHQNGRAIASPKDMEKNQRADKMLQTDPEIIKLLAGARFQVLIVAEYKDKATGVTVPVKGLIDILPALDGPYAKSLADFKTAVSADPKSWHKTVFNYGYHVQASFYLDIYTAATGEDRCEFLHVVQENVHPFVPERHALGLDFLTLGRNVYQQALSRYCHCLASNTWPRYSPVLGQLCLNGWHYAAPAPWMIEYPDPKFLSS